MAIVAEFISVIRKIRDVIYPEVNALYKDSLVLKKSIDAGKAEIDADLIQFNTNYSDFNTKKNQVDVAVASAQSSATSASNSAIIATNKSNEIKAITAQSTTGAPGTNAYAGYNPTDGKFTFVIPQGSKGDKGESFTVNSSGAIAQRALYDTQPAGWSFLDIITSTLYFKVSNTSGDWSSGVPFGKGDKGDIGNTGVGIESFTYISTNHISGLPAQPGGTDIYRVTLTNTLTFEYKVYNGLDNKLEILKTIEELLAYNGSDAVIVKDIKRGGTFVYKTAIEIDTNTGSLYTVNNGTVFAKLGGGFWVRQYSGAVNVKWFGAVGDGIVDDRQAFIDALNTADSIYAPSGNIFLFNVTGGRSTAPEVVSNKTLVIDGIIKSNYGQLKDNAPTLFRVTGDNVIFCGNGSLVGNGDINAINTGTVEQSPSLLWVEGDNFKIKDVIIDSPSKSGIILYRCMNADISTTFKGGYTADTYGETAYFGVNSLYGEGHRIHDCVFGLNKDGGKFVNSIFLVSNNCSITNNVAYHALEKLVYCVGNDNLIEGNSFLGRPIGSFTDAYRLMGNRNTLIANYAINTNGGCQILNGGQNRVINNTFINCKQVGVNINDSSSLGANSLSDNEVIGNYIEGIENTTFSGVQLVSSYKNVDNVKIEGNTITGINITNGNGILISNQNAFLMNNTIIANNKIDKCYNGISTYKAKYSNINNNNIKNIAVYPIGENQSVYSSICNNKIIGAGYNAFLGITSTTNFSGNTFNDKRNSGTAMLSTGFTTVVVHAGLAPHALITITNANATAGMLQAVTGLFTSNNGNGTFNITTGNYGNPSGNEILIYDIIQ